MPFFCPPVPLQEYLIQGAVLRDELERLVRAAGVEEAIPTPANLPWFDLLAHPAA